MNAQRSEKLTFALLLAATIIVVLPVLVIIGIVIKNGVGAITWEFISTAPRDGMRAGGILPAIVGTFCLMIGAMLFAVPLGVFSAIYLNEYAGDNLLTRLIRLAIINLAGVPSVVYGLFGLGVFVMFFKFGTSILAGAMTLSIMNLPVIITASREALSNVPQSFREVSLSLGATRWQTIRHVVLPNALPGILTGIILEVGRAGGETAPILFTVAAFSLPFLPHSVFDQCMALPTHLYAISTQVPNIGLDVRYATAMVLLAVVLIVNFFSIMLRMRLRRRRQW